MLIAVPASLRPKRRGSLRACVIWLSAPTTTAPWRRTVGFCPRRKRALERLLASGRRLVLVTGRELDDLQRVCHGSNCSSTWSPRTGALLYKPSHRRETPLAARLAGWVRQSFARKGCRPYFNRVCHCGDLGTARKYCAGDDPGPRSRVAGHFQQGCGHVSAGRGEQGHRSARRRWKRWSCRRTTRSESATPRTTTRCWLCVNARRRLRTRSRPLKGAADIVTTADHGAGVVELIDGLLRVMTSHRSSRG